MVDIIDIKTAIKYCFETIDKIGEFMGASSSHGNRFYINEAYELIEGMEKYLPVKVGSKVRLKETVDCNNGWRGSQHFLIKGAPATVELIGSYDGYIYADLVFDNESWIDSEGKLRPMDKKHTFRFHLDQIEVRKRNLNTTEQKQRHSKLDNLCKYVTALNDGMWLSGKISFRRVGRGLVHSYDEKWQSDVVFRVSNQGDIQYRTDKTGWKNPKYGDALSLLAGNEHSRGGTKYHIRLLQEKEPIESTDISGVV